MAQAEEGGRELNQVLNVVETVVDLYRQQYGTQLRVSVAQFCRSEDCCHHRRHHSVEPLDDRWPLSSSPCDPCAQQRRRQASPRPRTGHDPSGFDPGALCLGSAEELTDDVLAKLTCLLLKLRLDVLDKRVDLVLQLFGKQRRELLDRPLRDPDHARLIASRQRESWSRISSNAAAAAPLSTPPRPETSAPLASLPALELATSQSSVAPSTRCLRGFPLEMPAPLSWRRPAFHRSESRLSRRRGASICKRQWRPAPRLVRSTRAQVRPLRRRVRPRPRANRLARRWPQIACRAGVFRGHPLLKLRVAGGDHRCDPLVEVYRRRLALLLGTQLAEDAGSSVQFSPPRRARRQRRPSSSLQRVPVAFMRAPPCLGQRQLFYHARRDV